MEKKTNDQHGRAKPARLDFRLNPSVPTVLDGAWWPRSRNATAELADLVIALDAEQTQVTLIMLNPGGWHNHPRRIEAGGRSVQVAWISDLDPAVLIARTSHERVDLLVLFDDHKETSAASGVPQEPPIATLKGPPAGLDHRPEKGTQSDVGELDLGVADALTQPCQAVVEQPPQE